MTSEKSNKKQSDRVTAEDAQTLGEEPEIVEVSLEDIYAIREDVARQLSQESRIDTQHTDGSTYDPYEAQDQGLVYTPPTDPPVVPSDDLQGVEVATGFGQSMEESDPDVERLPPRVDNNDWDLVDDIEEVLKYNSETSTLGSLRVRVRDGIVTLTGYVSSEDDIAIVDRVVGDLDGVRRVINRLEVKDLGE